MALTFEYGATQVRNLGVVTTPDAKNRKMVKSVTIDGKPYNTSRRFWSSLQCRFGFSPNIFRYFDHEEVFNRISTRAPNDRIRYCAESDGTRNTLLAVTNPLNSTMRFDRLNELMDRYGAENVSYSDGIVRSTHRPRVGSAPVKIAGDEFVNQFVIDTPIDGYGRPNIYLSLLRVVCTNGAVGYYKAFRSEIAVGKTDEDMNFALIRAMEGFNNEEGFAAFRDRYGNAARSWASVNECQRLYKILTALAGRGELKREGKDVVATATGTEVVQTTLPIFQAYNALTGDLSGIYGISNMDNISAKRRRTLPTPCKVYDLLNFVTEVATHRSGQRGGRALQAFVGDLISNEYDLENTVDEYTDWRDFYIGNEKAAETMELLQNKR